MKEALILTKTCSKCLQSKNTSEFVKDKQKRDGYRSSCKACNIGYRASYYNKNREAAIKSSREWYANNKHRALEVHRDWVSANKEAANSIYRNRRARKKNAEGNHTSEDVCRLIRLQNNKCGCCRRILDGTKFHVDHIIPLFLRGSNNADNLQILCPTCNLQKGQKHPVDFMQEKGFLL